MSRDDREQNFDKALARHLGSSSAAQGNDCLDAETFAAYRVLPQRAARAEVRRRARRVVAWQPSARHRGKLFRRKSVQAIREPLRRCELPDCGVASA